jgi:hypothetical protein
VVIARYFGAIVFGVATAVAAWALVVGLHPMFSHVSLAALVPGLVAGLVGGFVAGWLAPRRKITIALLLGVLTAVYLMWSMLSRGITHGTHSPLLWYWPIWLIPTFSLGGYLSRSLWLPPNTSLERTRDR